MEEEMDGGETYAEDYKHPEILTNENPTGMIAMYEKVTGFLMIWGWYLIFGAVALLYIRYRLDPQIQAWMKRRKEQDLNNFDSRVARTNQEAMEAARMRMQQQHDAKAERHAEQVKQKEEQKRKEKVEDWERHQKGGGYRSKYKPPENSGASGSSASGSGTGSSQDKKAKKPLRPREFNPLTGDTGGGGVCFRPPRRGGGGGGG